MSIPALKINPAFLETANTQHASQQAGLSWWAQRTVAIEEHLYYSWSLQQALMENLVFDLGCAKHVLSIGRNLVEIL